MQAISNGGSADMARLLLKAVKEKQIKDKEEERREWQLAASSPVLFAFVACSMYAATAMYMDDYWLLSAVVQCLCTAA